MAEIGFTGSLATGFGSPLSQILNAEEIQPGSAVSYSQAKTIYEYHPFGKKMVDTPIKLAMSQPRDIEVAGAPDKVRQAFIDMWAQRRADATVENHRRISRIYGIGTLALIVDGEAHPEKPLDFSTLASKTIGFNVLDPLNTSGSTVLNQDPNDINFQRTAAVQVAGRSYHPSRTCVLLNEAPLYISFTTSSFGYTGRSVYQRALYPLKSFVQAMRTDDLVIRKAGVIIAKLKQVGSIIDNVVSNILGMKRAILRQSITDDVISVDAEDTIESLNLSNLDAPYMLARKNVIENLALSADMPAILLNSESYAEGFGEGSEDAKNVARYIEGERQAMSPTYEFLDPVIQRLAWTPAFFEIIKAEQPDAYRAMDFNTAFYQWSNAFSATFPSLLIEPESERIKVDETRFKTALAAVEIYLPDLDPANKAKTMLWLADLMSNQKLLFPVPLILDPDTLEDFLEQKQGQADEAAQAALTPQGGGETGEDKEPVMPGPFSSEA